MLAPDRREHIIKHSIEFFAQHGFSVSTRALAQYIGMTQPLLYRHFGSKEDLIATVTREVFFARWNPNWETLLLDTSQPLEARLVRYLEDYTDNILQDKWIRLFIFAALHDPIHNQEYLDLLRRKVFIPILRELRNQHDLSPEPTEMDVELFWGFHSSFFYIGVRHWIYKLPAPGDIAQVIQCRVRHFLCGYRSQLQQQAQKK